MAASQSVYEIVTAQITDALEKGVVPWRKPWMTIGGHRNLNSKRPYRGINAFLLALSPYSSPFWMTYKGAQKAGGQVRKGEKGTVVVFWKTMVVDDEKNPGQKKTIPYLRYYKVWNLEQTEGVEAPKQKEFVEWDAIEEAQRVIDEMQNAPVITHGGNRAYYVPKTDELQLPAKKQFPKPENYYLTAYHELGHSTGHESRLGRKQWGQFGSETYSKEELVAEMTAAMVAGMIGMDSTIESSAGYIKGWLSALNDDPKMVVAAASQAQKAANYILNIDDTPVKEEAK